jgi:DNA-binding NtrC family response regulator
LLAKDSTLLLGEVPMLPRDLQTRLVAALDGGVRLLATTTVEPEAALDDERLWPELYFTLTTMVLRLLPLRRRRDELPVLAQHFLERVNQRGGEQRSGFTPRAIATLMAYDWPGNLPELARVVESAHGHSRGEGGLVAPDDLPASIRGALGAGFNPPVAPSPIKPLDELLTEVERRLIETALRQARSNKSRAAETLGISRPRLYRRIKELGLPDDEEQAEEGEPPS